MNRLTNESGICTDCQGIAYCKSDCLNKQIYDRLKEYEDTGLSPEKIEHMKARLPLRVWLSETPEKMSIFGMTIAELIKLSNLKKQERLYITERWIEVDDGAYPDGFPKSKYKHESCGAIVDNCSHFCPQCGKRVNRVKILRYGFEDIDTKFFEEHGYIVE